jgi:hypothetical protein
MNVDAPISHFDDVRLLRPEVRAYDAITMLADFALVTYTVDPITLKQFLPPGFEPEIRATEGGPRAFVSAVPFRDYNFHFGAASLPRFSMGQTNYRAYVRYRGEPCVWFFGTSLTRPLVYIPSVLWRLPWHPAVMRFDTRWDGEVCRRYTLRTRAMWAPVEMDLEGTDQPAGCLDGFADEDETAFILTHPVAGYYYRRDGRLGSYAVWHPRLRMRRARAVHVRFALFERLGLIEPAAAPHSILVQRETEFQIQLPPRLVD